MLLLMTLFHVIIYATCDENPANICQKMRKSVYLNKRCVVPYDYSLDWYEAKNYCSTNFQTYKGRLTEATTFGERQSLTYLLQQMFTSTFLPWIALKKLDNNNWSWDDSGKIQNVGGASTNGNCMLLRGSSMKNADCQEKHFFSCEMEINDLEPITDVCFPLGDAFYINDKCYQMTNISFSWPHAMQHCADLNSALTNITSLDDWTFIREYFNDIHKNVDKVWLPANTNDADIIQMYEPFWAPGFPTNLTKDTCVALYSDGFLRNENCSILIATICEKDISDPCRKKNGGWYFQGNCYIISNFEATLRQAEIACLSNNSHLAESDTLESKLIIKRNIFYKNSSVNSVWLGAIKENGIYRWLATGKEINFTDIDTTQNKESLVLHRVSDGSIKLESRMINESYFFICQTPVTQPRYSEYVAVIPVMDQAVSAELQIVSSYNRLTAYLTIVQCCDESDESNISYMPLTPARPVVASLENWLTQRKLGIQNRYIKVKSTQPVSMILFITDTKGNYTGATLVLPYNMYADNTAQVMVLHTAIDQLTDQSISVVSMSSQAASISLIYNDVQETEDIFTKGHKMRSVKKFFTIVRSMHTSFNLAACVYPRSNILLSTEPVALFISNKAIKNNTCENYKDDFDFTFDQSTPLELAGSSYISFPVELNCTDEYNSSYTIIALHNKTTINVTGLSQNILQVNLETVGDSTVLSLPQNKPYLFDSTSNFIITIHHKIQTDINTKTKSVCQASLIPQHLWKFQYDFYNSMSANNYKVVVYLIMNADLKDWIEINGKSINLNCVTIPGTNWTVCNYFLPTTVAYFHIQLRYHSYTFGSYVLAYNDYTAFCTTLGVSEDPHFREIINRTDFFNENNVNEFHQTKMRDSCSNLKKRHTTTTEETEEITDYTSSTNKLIIETTAVTCLPTISNKTPLVNLTTASPPTTSHTTIVTMRPTVEELQKKRETIVKTLSVDKMKVLVYRMTKKGINDERPSAQAVGAVGVVILSFVACVICLSDFFTLFNFIYSILRNN